PLPDHLRRFRVLATHELARGFSRQHGITHFTKNGSASRLSPMVCGFTYTPAYTLTPGQPPPGRATHLRHPITYILQDRFPHQQPTQPKGHAGHQPRYHHPPRYERPPTGTGISTRSPSTTPVGLALGPDSPWAD